MNFRDPANLPGRPGNETQALLQAAVDAVILIDHEGHIQAFNPSAEQLFGYSEAELLGRNVTLLMSEADRIAHDGYLARYLATRTPHIIGKGREVLARRKDGSTFPAFLSVGVVADAEPPRFVGFLQDLTSSHRRDQEAHALQERLWHVSRLATVGELASGISHELNQPLAAIANYAQACDRLLESPAADLEEIHGALKEITTQAVRAGDIIRTMRALARQRDDQRDVTDVNRLVIELAALVQADARVHSVRYRCELGTGLPLVELHKSQIQQVILNLVRNAIEALAETPHERREVVVRTAQTRDGDVEISVCDTGPGISPAIAPRLFDPFCSSKPTGTGLGLAISRTIVGSHTGTLDYRPNEPTGACFTVRLPLHREVKL